MKQTVPIAVVTTVLNERGSIENLLRSIDGQTVTPSQVVICDGGSTDGTVELLNDWMSSRDFRVDLLQRANANISEGRNLAIEAATCVYVAVTDGGTTLCESWLEGLYEALDGGADVAAGFFMPVGSSFMQRTISRCITPRLEEISPETFLPSSRSVAFRRELWREVGGYPEWLDYCEDLVFDFSLKATGAKFLFVPHSIAFWDGRATLGAYWKQYFRYARGDGKANLWPRRHFSRYSAYFGSALVLAKRPRSPYVWTALLIGYGLYSKKVYQRLWHRKTGDRLRHLIGSLALVPVIITLGDIGKMIGYPIGLRWRVRHGSDITAVARADGLAYRGECGD